MKLPTTPRTISLSLAAVAVAFVSGMTIMSHAQMPVHLNGSYKTADTTITDPTSTSSGTTTQSTTTSDPSSTVAPSGTTTTSSGTTTTASPSASTNTSPSTSTSQTTTQSAPAPAVTAVSAVLQPWTDPVPSASQGGILDTTTGQTTPFPTEVQYEYCLYTYSDGSTKTTTIITQWLTNGHLSVQMRNGLDCTLAEAPAAN